MAMHNGVIKEIDFFKDKDEVFIYSIVPFLRHIFVPRLDYIYRENEYADEFYFLSDGDISISSQKYDLVQHFTKGACFGDIEVVSLINRQFDARAARNSELLIIDKNVIYKQLVRVIKEDFRHIWIVIEKDAMKKLESIQKYSSKLPAPDQDLIKMSLITYKNLDELQSVSNPDLNTIKEETYNTEHLELNKFIKTSESKTHSITELNYRARRLTVAHAFYVSIEAS